MLIVTSNNSERRAVLDILHTKKQLVTGSNDRRAHIGSVNETLAVVLDGSGGFSHQYSATRFAIEYLSNSDFPRPSLVIICGVCWGNPKRVTIGDVVVSSTVISVNRNTAKPEALEYRSYTYESPYLLNHFGIPDTPPIKTGPLLSLETQIADEAARDSLLNEHPTACGGEMEGFALIPSCARMSIPWLMVKGVSDYAEFDHDRSTQPEVSAAAAFTVRNIVAEHGANLAKEADASTESARLDLVSTLEGREIVLLRHELDFNNLKVSVQSHFDRLLGKTDFYTGAGAVSAGLSRSLTRLLLELALNAFAHTAAKKVRISLDPYGASYRDDGPLFSLRDLEVAERARGGAASWRAFQRDFVTNNMVTVVKEVAGDGATNHYRFCIPNALEALVIAKANCKAEIDVKSARAGRKPALVFNTDCEEVYVDLDEISMMSVALDICEEFAPLLEEGRRLLVACSDGDLAHMIEQRFPAAISDGRINFLPGRFF